MIKNRFLCITILFSCLALLSTAQTKKVEFANMGITIPTTWTYYTQEDDVLDGAVVVVLGDDNDNIYSLMEYGITGNLAEFFKNGFMNSDNPLTQYAEWGEIEHTKFLNYDAFKVFFNNVLSGITKVGVVYGFCDGEQSYFIMAMAPPGYNFNQDCVISSFHLTGKKKFVASTKSTREQLNDVITEFRSYFGKQVATGITFDNLILHPTKDELTFVYGISIISIDDLSANDIEEFKDGMAVEMVDALKEMMHSIPVFDQCAKENYTFIIKILDKDKKEIFTHTLKPKDYNK